RHRASTPVYTLVLHDALPIVHEALASVLDFGFSALGLNSIMAVVDPANLPFINLLEKFHFEKEAYLKENIFFEVRFLDTMVYSLDRKSTRLNSSHVTISYAVF